MNTENSVKGFAGIFQPLDVLFNVLSHVTQILRGVAIVGAGIPISAPSQLLTQSLPFYQSQCVCSVTRLVALEAHWNLELELLHLIYSDFDVISDCDKNPSIFQKIKSWQS